MNAKIDAKFNNKYHIELIDSVSGEVKQSGDFHNIATVNINACIVGGTGASSTEMTTGQMRYNDMAYQLRVGSGTTEPAYSNTNLASPLWTIRADSRVFDWADDYTGRCTSVFTIPASTSYVATITEVGLVARFEDEWPDAIGTYFGNPLVTRSLLTDSEGNIISFEKTDLDILKITVVVEITIASLSDNFVIFKHPYVAKMMLTNSVPWTYALEAMYGYLNLCRYYFDLDNYERINAGENIDTSISVTNVYMACKYNVNEAYVRYPVVRLGTGSITSERYFKGIAIPSLGCWKLPNEDVFPAYTISGINVGTGDGNTTEFENPLCYFKEGTDKVYKNGVLLTRGVDYTISNIGNKDCLPEVAEFKAPISVKTASTASSSFNFRPLFVPAASSYADGTKYAKWFSNASPLYIEYEEAITANCLKCTGGLRALQGTNGYTTISPGTVFYLDASPDGITYEEVGSASITGNGYATETAFTIDFADTTAKYWRLRTSYTSYPIGLYYDTNYPYYMMLNRKDPYIIFAVAPAQGDVITMDVDMDVIMKNSNFVVDVGCRIDFNIGG